MKCKKCGHPLSQDEVNVNMCWECGAIIDPEFVSDDKLGAEKMIANVERAQKEQDQKQKIEEQQEQEAEAGAEHGVISVIHTFFAILSIISIIGSIIAGAALESFWVSLFVILWVCITYCVVRLLVAIAYLLCDIKDNTASILKRTKGHR